MSQVPPYRPFRLSPDELRDAVVRYASNPIYHDNPEWVVDDNPYRRQLRPQVLPHLDLSRPQQRNEVLHYPDLAAQRLAVAR